MPEEALYYNAVAIALRGDTLRMRRNAHFGSWKRAYELLVKTDIPIPEPEKAWDAVREKEIRLTFRGDPGFPRLLQEITPAPLALYVRGTIPRNPHTIAIVGTRRATPDGNRLARQFGYELAAAGCAIVSGLALGIDAAAHTGALEAGGSCIAVLANGLDRTYPEANRRLSEKILSSGGAIISEYPPGEHPLKYRFLERNRVISGIASGTLVVEAPEASGSLATAGFALEQNRDVFVIPGAITHPNFRGSNGLIRQGAELVAKPEDILSVYGIKKCRGAMAQSDAASPEEKLIVKALTSVSRPLDVDKIIAMTKLEPRVANQTLTFLLLRKVVRETGGQYTI